MCYKNNSYTQCRTIEKRHAKSGAPKAPLFFQADNRFATSHDLKVKILWLGRGRGWTGEMIWIDTSILASLQEHPSLGMPNRYDTRAHNK